MTDFVDGAARVMATPVLRRDVLRRLGCALLGAGVLGALTACNLQCGGKWYCADTKTCCPSGYGYDCGGSCYQNGCPPNLNQTATCH